MPTDVAPTTPRGRWRGGHKHVPKATTTSPLTVGNHIAGTGTSRGLERHDKNAYLIRVPRDRGMVVKEATACGIERYLDSGS